MKLTPESLCHIIGGKWIKKPQGDIFRTDAREISIDSRTLSPGDVFFALTGKSFDGNDFAEEALRKGAFLVVVSKQIPHIDVKGGIIEVTDTLESLQTLASKWREMHPCPIVAVTGSSGKTTTKELITCILSQKINCLSTLKNMNNHIGVPLTLLRLRDYHEAGVLELGMNHKGEIAKLTSMVKPRIGIITNIGKAHIGYLDSINGVLEAKAELLEYMDSDSIAILDQDSPFYNILASKCRNGIISVGESAEADLIIENINIIPNEARTYVTFRIKEESFTFSVPLLGRFIAYDLLMAVAAAIQFGCSSKEIESGIAMFIPLPGRMYHSIVGGIHILDDSYNANPESVHLALKTLIECKGTGKSMAILGDMLELGNQAECLHRQLGQWLGYKRKVDFIITYGPHAHIMAQEAIKSGYPPKMIWSLNDHEEISNLANSLLHSKDWVLIKGSRQMGLDTVFRKLSELISCRNGSRRNGNIQRKD